REAGEVRFDLPAYLNAVNVRQPHIEQDQIRRRDLAMLDRGPSGCATGYVIAMLPQDVHLQVATGLVVVDHQNPGSGIAHCVTIERPRCRASSIASISAPADRSNLDMILDARCSNERASGSRMADVNTITGILTIDIPVKLVSS